MSEAFVHRKERGVYASNFIFGSQDVWEVSPPVCSRRAWMEKMDSLWPGGPHYYYDESCFPPSTDAFVLGGFPRLRRGERVCDLCCGMGLVGFLLSAREPSLHLTGLELHPEPLVFARRSAAESGFSAQFLQGDLRCRETLPPAGSFDLVVCNPPYFSPGSGVLPPDPVRRAARAEVSATIEEVCAAAGYLLRWGGRAAVVYRPERLCDLLCALRSCGVEPKRIRMVENQPGAAPSLVLVEGRRGGKPGLAVEQPLRLRDASGAETAEAAALYFRNRSTEDLSL